MALPELDMMLSNPAQVAEDGPPLEIELSAGSEWRFEVGFEGGGIKVKVKIIKDQIKYM